MNIHIYITPNLDRLTVEILQKFEAEICPIFLQIFHKIETEGPIPSSCNEANVILMPRAREGTTY